MDKDEILSAFAHPAVCLALRRALNKAFDDCVYLAAFGVVANAAYLGRAAEREALGRALNCAETAAQELKDRQPS